MLKPSTLFVALSVGAIFQTGCGLGAASNQLPILSSQVHTGSKWNLQQVTGSSSSPRWLSQLAGILSEIDKEPALVLSTIDVGEGIPIPRARHHLYRDILVGNPNTPVIITTSDVRASKVHQLCSHPNSTALNAEVAWWFSYAHTQFRLSARTHVLPSPLHALHSRFPTRLLLGPNSEKNILNVPKTSEDWEEYRVGMFNSLPASLRASFAHPVPGSLLSNPDDAKKWPKEIPKAGEEGSKEEEKYVKEALHNFAVLVLEPVEVDVLVLEFNPATRTKWERLQKGWKEQAIVP